MNFEKYYWIPLDKTKDRTYEVDDSYLLRRGIYKDVVFSLEKKD